jgi:hypothetical protein
MDSFMRIEPEPFHTSLAETSMSRLHLSMARGLEIGSALLSLPRPAAWVQRRRPGWRHINIAFRMASIASCQAPAQIFP